MRDAQLFHDIAGVLLRHDSFGNHLDLSGKATDCELEKKNFFKAAQVLAEEWPKTVIDDHKVDAEALPIGNEYDLETVDAAWAKKHVRQLQYSIQIIKYTDSNCCKKFQTN